MIQTEEVIYCGVCGEGWSADWWGRENARRQAAACYEKHIQAGDIDDVATRAYFLSGGRFGYVKGAIGGKIRLLKGDTQLI